MANATLLAGWAMEDITPERDVALLGQFHDRISLGVLDPITVTALAMESTDSSGTSVSQSVMVSCDLCSVAPHILHHVKKKISEILADFNSNNIFLAATHIHTGPYHSRSGSFENPDDYLFGWPDKYGGIMTPEEYAAFLVNKLCDAIAAAWNNRKKSGVSWQLGHAGIGHNRRVLYDDGTAVMYGNSDTPNYRGPEGPEDSGVELLYFWNGNDELTGIVVNVACPSQVVEDMSYISADYWGEVRKKVWGRYGKRVCVFAMCGAAGDQSPRDMARRDRGENNMSAVEGMVEIGERLLGVIKYKYDAAKKNIVRNPVLRHTVKHIPLPYRGVTKKEYEEAGKRYCALAGKYGDGIKPPISEGNYELFGDVNELYESIGVMKRYKDILKSPVYTMEAHFIRLGNIAIATNPFELFTVYGLMIKARSVAEQTFIAQLACDDAGYLATEAAIKGGSYSTPVAAGLVGPEGGRLLVDYSVKYINEMWDEEYEHGT